MARKRMIDPSFWTDEKLGECGRDERLLFMGLISNSDDEGYGRANIKLLKSTIFPYDTIKPSDIEKWLLKLSEKALVMLYSAEGQAYYFLPNFTKHQTINKPTKSSFPQHEVGLPYDYRSTTVALPPNRIEENRREVNTIESRFPPTVEDVAEYCKERNNGIDAEQFIAHYKARHWMSGKTAIKDWKSCVITWEKNRKEKQSTNPQHQFMKHDYDVKKLEALFDVDASQKKEEAETQRLHEEAKKLAKANPDTIKQFIGGFGKI